MRTIKLCWFVMHENIKTIRRYTKSNAHSVRLSKKITINWSSLNMVYFFFVFPMFYRQYTRIYWDMNKWASFSKNKSLNKNNDVFYIHVNEDNCMHLDSSIEIYKYSIQGFSHLFQTHYWLLRGIWLYRVLASFYPNLTKQGCSFCLK